MTLPTPSRLPVPAEQRERLQRWLREWAVFRSLGDAPADAAARTPPAGPPGADAAAVVRRVRPPDAAVEPGQVRLLHPRHSPDEPRYAAALEMHADGYVTLVPFGLFAEPALPGEVRLDRPVPLRVLCAWNAVRVPLRVVAAGWMIDRLGAAERAVLRQVRTAPADGTPLPAEIAARTGPPLAHPLDPRHDYLAMETDTWTELAATPPGIVYPLREDSAWPKAAEDREPYGDE